MEKTEVIKTNPPEVDAQDNKAPDTVAVSAVDPAPESVSPEEAEAIRKMMELGVFYGHSKSRTNPKMRQFILTNRSGFGVIDLQKTLNSLKEAKSAVSDVVSREGTVILVGTSPSVKETIKTMAEELGLPYVTERWLGGTLTNFETISKRIKHFKDLKEQKSSGGWDKYTKKEKLSLSRELVKMERLFGGIEDLTKVPDLMFVADTTNNYHAAKEARESGVKVVGIINTDANPDSVDYGIVANEKNPKSAGFVIEQIREAIEDGRKRIPATKKPKEEEAASTKGEKTKEDGK